MNRKGIVTLVVVSFFVAIAAAIFGYSHLKCASLADIRQDVERKEAYATTILLGKPARTGVRITTQDGTMANYIAMTKAKRPVELEVAFRNADDESMNIIMAIDGVSGYSYKRGSAVLQRSSGDVSEETPCKPTLIRDGKAKSLKLAVNNCGPDETVILKLTLVPKTKLSKELVFMDQLALRVYDVSHDTQMYQQFYLARQNSFLKRLLAVTLPNWYVGMFCALAFTGFWHLILRDDVIYATSKTQSGNPPNTSTTLDRRTRVATRSSRVVGQGTRDPNSRAVLNGSGYAASSDGSVRPDTHRR